MFVWLPTFLSDLNPVQRDILPHRQSQLCDLTIRLHITTSLKSISQKRWLYHHILYSKWSIWPVQLYQCKSRDQSFFVLIGQIAFSWYTVMINRKYVNVQTSVVDPELGLLQFYKVGQSLWTLIRTFCCTRSMHHGSQNVAVYFWYLTQANLNYISLFRSFPHRKTWKTDKFSQWPCVNTHAYTRPVLNGTILFNCQSQCPNNTS